MNDLIRALIIFDNYTSADYPTHCEHDILYVMVDPTEVSSSHLALLETLGFLPDEENNHFYSYRFGSC